MKDIPVVYVPVEVLKTPVDGRVLVNRWWTVHPEKGATFHTPNPNNLDDLRPQCNLSEELVKRVAVTTYPQHGVRKIDVAFLGGISRYLKGGR